MAPSLCARDHKGPVHQQPGGGGPAIDHGVPIRFDETAWSPYLRYWQYGIQHEIWFEDVRSIQGKFGLIREYGLLGAGYWQLMNFFRPNWLLMEEEFRIIRNN